MANNTGKSNTGENVLATIVGALKGYGNIMGERTKIQSQMMANQLEMSQNWFAKMQMKQMEQQMNDQQVQTAFNQGGQEAGMQMGYSPEGNRILTNPSQSAIQQGIYNAIKRKAAADPKSLDEKDKEFISVYEGRSRLPLQGKADHVDEFLKSWEEQFNGQTSTPDLRNRAIKELQDAGYPVTEGNIAGAMKQLQE